MNALLDAARSLVVHPPPAVPPGPAGARHHLAAPPGAESGTSGGAPGTRTGTPRAPGREPGTRDGGPGAVEPPAGVVLAARTPWFELTGHAGHRTARFDGGVRAGAEPMTIGTHHDLASVTKMLATTTALMRLVSGGLVGLDVPVRHYLPRFAGGDEVTVRDLLLHRAGLWEWWPLYIAADQGGDAEAAGRLAEELPPRHRPRTARHYSDLGFVLLGRIVARASGLPLDRAVAALVTGPLGLPATRYAAPAGTEVATGARDDRVEMAMLDTGRPYPTPYRAADFTRWRRGPVHGQVSDGNAFHALGGVSGHAGLFSTVPDLLRYAGALAGPEPLGGLVRPETAREFFAPGPDEGQSPGFRRYRLRAAGETLTVLGHPGYVGCAVGFVPGRDIALVLAANRLLVTGAPVPTDALWHALLAAVAAQIDQARP
ncbi:hypothetical protein Sru01_00860 [Sphaerisporangium rufum]|uniref:Beta-lactamase-related domain-containing protein n=1 Tax=Sphaerisporangium rufum TaxID=1381558 RepID=A0A919UWR6_9ACTN|nr:serine hydrolase domain-containing protein [Sphaerisporangium rufum]GII75104.1 hypothetical protein Sru01_00860 [Sphaerisporangium rufum]